MSSGTIFFVFKMINGICFRNMTWVPKKPDLFFGPPISYKENPQNFKTQFEDKMDNFITIQQQKINKCIHVQIVVNNDGKSKN